MRTGFDTVAFSAWLKTNSKHSPPLRPELIHASHLAVDPNRPVITNGILAGTQAAQALQADRAYVAAPPAAKIEALKVAPATGCAMLLTLAREKSGYNPLEPAGPDSEGKFMRYIYQIIVCPLFRKDIDDRITDVFGGDWNEVIERIISLYVGLAEQDRAILRTSLRSVAAAASSSPSTTEEICTFFQSTIDSSNTISTFLYYMNVKMVTYVDHGGKNEPDRVRNQADLVLHRVKMAFDAGQWAGQAQNVYRETQSSLSDWLANNSTPTGALPRDWHPR